MPSPPTASDPLFFLDYDGTLAPIVEDPEAAHPHPEVPMILQALRVRHPVWIVTGRDVRSLERFLSQDLPVIGLHGAQEGEIGGAVEDRMSEEAADALARQRDALPAVDGLEVEEKDGAFAVHYRGAAPDDVTDRLEAWVDAMPEMLDAIWGKQVVELRPKGLTKGTAVRRIADRHPDCTPVYLGDDTTDEDAFRALQAMGREAVTVKVGPADTAAEYRLDGPDDVVGYLKRYV